MSALTLAALVTYPNWPSKIGLAELSVFECVEKLFASPCVFWHVHPAFLAVQSSNFAVPCKTLN